MSSDSYVMSIPVFCENGKTFYIVDGYKYDSEFPLKWALNHLSKPYEDPSGNIFMNGSGPKDCENCRAYGTKNGIFKEYCVSCLSYVYNGRRYIPQFTNSDDYADNEDIEEYKYNDSTEYIHQNAEEEDNNMDSDEENDNNMDTDEENDNNMDIDEELYEIRLDRFKSINKDR